MSKKILKNDLLFHSVHGLCRVDSVGRTAPSTEICYSLRPVSQSKSKARFTISMEYLGDSGFNKLVSEGQVAAIFEFLKTGDKKSTTQGNAWTLAETLRLESCNKEPSKDKRKGQKINQVVKSLANELAIVLQSTVDEVAAKIQESLGAASKINPLVLTALADAKFDIV